MLAAVLHRWRHFLSFWVNQLRLSYVLHLSNFRGSPLVRARHWSALLLINGGVGGER
jgi:hypothetical protein